MKNNFKIYLNNFQKNKLKYFVIICVLLVFAIFAYGIYKSSVIPASKSYHASFGNSSAEIAIGELVTSKVITQTFMSNEDIYGFSIKFGTYMRQNQGMLAISLLDIASNKIVYENRLQTSDLVDNQFHEFILDIPLLNTQVNQYKIIITTIGESSEGNAVTIWSSTGDNYVEGLCTINGINTNGDLCFLVYDSSNSFIVPVYWAITCMLLCVFVFVINMMFKKNWKLEHLFLVSILSIGFVYSLVMSPQSIPDEPAHFQTAYRYSNDFLFIGHETESGGLLQRSDDALVINQFSTNPNIQLYSSVYENFLGKIQNSSLIDSSGYNIKSAPYLYFPAATGITVARLLSLSPICLYYFGRYANFLFYSIATFYALKKIPFGKKILFVVALLPMAVHQSISYSYDAIVNALAFLYIGYCLYVAYSDKDIKGKDIITLCFLGALLAPAKAVYAPICLLVLLIPKERFSSLNIRGNKNIKCKIMILGSSILSSLIFNLPNFILNYLFPKSAALKYTGETLYTVSYFVSNPLRLLKIIYNTIIDQCSNYLQTMLGQNLGWLNVYVPSIIISAFLVILIISLFKEEFEKKYFTTKSRFLIIFILCSVLGLVFAGLLLGWTPNNSNIISGVQGRYFLPILPLALLLLRNESIVVKKDNTRFIVLMVWILQIFTLGYIFKSLI